ncbi:hypothetical protein [Bacillus sp. AK031]
MPKAYLVNTNKSQNPHNEPEMLEEQKVAAYYSPWKYLINHIEANDMVYLYSNGNGIIARGFGSGIIEKAGEDDLEHNMPLLQFEQLDEPLPPSAIVQIAQGVTDENYRIKWNQTLIPLQPFIGEEIWRYITKNNI